MSEEIDYTDPQSRWNALVNRDSDAIGQFFYGVKTTGIYCRPGCSSILPNRKNVVFFAASREAEKAGYRACKRCNPSEAFPHANLSQKMVQACRKIEESESPPSLEELAADAGFSPWHFQRTFKKVIGLSPKEFGASKQVKRFLESLKKNSSITEAIYNAGFSSSGRAYEKTRQRLGMVPSLYKNGGSGMHIQYGLAACSLGSVLVARTEKGICCIELGDDSKELVRLINERFSKAQLVKAGQEFSLLIQKVICFIEEPGTKVELPLDIQGTVFQEKVWIALRDIPVGVTRSYSEIAKDIGMPKATRAVAKACASNQLAVVIPCHRVIRSDGKLGGYRWGLRRKSILLERESHLDQSPKHDNIDKS